MGEAQVAPADILAFWRDAGPDRWYTPDDAFDIEVRRRYLDLWQRAAAGELSSWEGSDDGALALVIVLDQFPRNLFRDDIRTYASDAHAREVASRAIERGVTGGSMPPCGNSSICRSCIRSIWPTSCAASSCRGRQAWPKVRSGPNTTPTSSGGSGVFLTATAFWAARPRQRSRPSWTKGAFRPDDGSVNGRYRCRFNLR